MYDRKTDKKSFPKESIAKEIKTLVLVNTSVCGPMEIKYQW